MIGQTLSHFRITAKLGEGGMGEVYRAEDTKLDRQVAIKVLPEAFTADPERFARFEREAKVLASLNHPNIAGIHELGSDGDVHFLAMELVEGEDLADRLGKGPIPVDESLRFAIQIATGLEAAHGSGVVHRDLKPANVKLTPEGQVKILDFGLAKIGAGADPNVDLSMSPTLTAQMTQAGTILGTAAYMSPEQARGKEVDGQTDIWALGVVLYEMLTGQRTFAGDTATDTIARIIERQPDWEALPPETPPLARSVLRRCLEKDRARRLHDVADARLELEEALQEPAAAPSEAQVPVTPSRKFPARLALIAVLAALASALVTVWITREAPRSPDATTRAHLTVDLAEDTSLYMLDNPAMTLSPDARTLVWAANSPDGVSRLYVRGLDQHEAKPIEGTEDAFGPFFSPDGRWVAYIDQAEATLEKVTVDGGFPVKICDVPKSSKGGAWGDRGEIVFSWGHDAGLYRVSEDGGSPEMLTQPDRAAGVKTHRFPQFLPGGSTVLFMIGDTEIATFNEARIAALDLDTGEQKILVDGGMSPRFSTSGHLVFAREGRLMAAPFDAERVELQAPPKPVFEGLVTHDGNGYGQYTLAPDGSLLYAPGGPEWYYSRLVQADRTGRIEDLPLPERAYSRFDFSPDGRRLAIVVMGANFDIWLWESEREILSRLTAGGNNQNPTWGPESRRLFFQSDRHTPGRNGFFMVPADGSRQAELIYESSVLAWVSSWSRDGRSLAFMQWSPEADYDIWMLPLDGGKPSGDPTMLIGSNAREMWPIFSPDSRWLAYTSDETGTQEVHVRSSTGAGSRQQVSSGGGAHPQWGPRGETIFYLDPATSRMMKASITTQPELRIGAPEALFEAEFSYTGFRLSPDGEHFVFLQPGSQSRPMDRLRLVFDWAEGLSELFTDAD